jgi:hypothetical protein
MLCWLNNIQIFKKGKETIKIIGEDFPENLSTIFIGNVTEDVIAYSNYSIIIESPAMAPGLYKIENNSEFLGNFK